MHWTAMNLSVSNSSQHRGINKKRDVNLSRDKPVTSLEIINCGVHLQVQTFRWLTSASWNRADCRHGFPSGAAERDDCGEEVKSLVNH